MSSTSENTKPRTSVADGFTSNVGQTLGVLATLTVGSQLLNRIATQQPQPLSKLNSPGPIDESTRVIELR